MKKLLLMSGLFLALFGFAKATEITMTQGQGTVYGHSDTVYGAPTGPAGEIYPVRGPLLFGTISAASGGFATVTVDVDTDYAADYYDAGDLPNGGELWIDLF